MASTTTIESPAVQLSLPNLSGLRDTVGFEAFLTNPPRTITSNPIDLRRMIKNYAIQLDRIESNTPIWEQQVCDICLETVPSLFS
jgi:hypothetical protein